MEAQGETARPPTWHEIYQVGSYWSDISGHLYPHAMLQMMHESAWKHAEALSFGYTDLERRSLMWVLSRLTVDITRLPEWGESVRLETWPTGTHKLFGMREYSLFDEHERELLRANSAWLVFDAERRRPQKPGPVVESAGIPLNPGNYDEPPPKLDPSLAGSDFSGDPIEPATHRVRYSDIDVQRHVNKAKYLEWMLDALPDDWLIRYRPRTLSINFLRECEIGDTLGIAGRFGRDGRQVHTYHSACLEGDGKNACVLFAKWQHRES